jgi:hypothetical protein
MDVIAHARAVGRVVVVAVDEELVALADGDLAGDLGQQRRRPGRLPDPALRIRARHVEVAQRHIVQQIDVRNVPEHLLGHEFRAPVGVDRAGRRLFRRDAVFGDAVNGGRGREDEMPDVGFQAPLEQRPARGRVVAVVLERVGDRFRHDRVRGEVQHRVDVVAREDLLEAVRIARVADDEIAVEHGLAEARREVVEHDDRFAGLPELPDHVRADVTGAAGHEYRFVSHLASSLPVITRPNESSSW